MKMKNLTAFSFDKKVRFNILNRLGFYNHLSDEDFLKKAFRIRMGYELNLDHPVTFNEKIQWLKIHDRRPEYTTMVDKYAVKKYVADIIGEEYIIPTYGVWDRFDDINFDELPNEFVLKCNHDSGGLVICRDKSKLDIKAARKKINRCLNRNYYWHGREWAYKDVKPKIIAEKYMVDESGFELKDYKVFNFDGTPKVIEVDFDRFSNHMRNLYNTDWELIRGEIKYKSDSQKIIAKPECLEEMLSVAHNLSDGIPHVRTDFYCIDQRIYFGEMTFYHGCGFETFRPSDLNVEFGEWLKLPTGGGYLVKGEGYTIYIHECTSAKEQRGLTDYKFYCFNGEPCYLYVSEGLENHATAKISFLTMDWKFASFHRGDFTPFGELPRKPEHFDDMIRLSRKLAEGHTFLRVDLYEINHRVFFSELTFYPCNGFMPFEPKEWDWKLGEYIR